jgi:hypothetical protein
MDWKLCPDYLLRDFIEPELHLRPPLSRWAAWAVSKACVALMKIIQAIPVYGKTMKLAATWKRSLKNLKRNEWLVIFPENDEKPFNDVMNELDDGFIGLAPLYYQSTRRILKFIPVAVHRTAKAIKIGKPVCCDPKAVFPSERERIKTSLQTSIVEMYSSLEELGTAASPASVIPTSQG